MSDGDTYDDDLPIDEMVTKVGEHVAWLHAYVTELEAAIQELSPVWHVRVINDCVERANAKAVKG